MKTKLLKIVRKRYEVLFNTKTDIISWPECTKDNPLYTVYDNDLEHTRCFERSHENAMNMLTHIIKIDYASTKKTRRKIQKKMWYNG